MKFLRGVKGNFPKERFAFGLDIGSREIKIVKLKLSKDSTELCGFDITSVQLDMGEALKKFRQSLDTLSVNIGVCGPSTVIRYVDFPLMNKGELKQALKFEAQKHIPFSMNEVHIDGHVLKEDMANNKMLILIAAVKKELVSQRVKLIGDAGLKVNLVDIDSLALFNAFNHNYGQQEDVKEKAVALLNIGSALSSLNILENGMPRLSRDIHIAGNNFTQRLADAFGMDFKSAEELKVNPDEERSSEVTAGMETVLANLAGEVRVSFDYYESQSTSSVAKIFLSGGASRFAGFKDMFSDLIGIEVEYWDPLKMIPLSGPVDAGKVKSLSGQLAVAVGLALRG